MDEKRPAPDGEAVKFVVLPKGLVKGEKGREGCSGCEAKRPVPFGIVFIQNNAENICCVSQK